VVDDIRPGRVLVPAVLLRDQEMMKGIIERAQIDQLGASSPRSAFMIGIMIIA